MSEFRKNSTSNSFIDDNRAVDAFSDSDWDAADFEQEISSSLDENLKDSSDPQWNDMLDDFNSENFDENGDNDGFDDDFDNDNDMSDDFGSDNDMSDDFDSDFDDDNGMNDDFDDDFDDGSDTGSDFRSDFSNDYKPDFSDDFHDEPAGNAPAEKTQKNDKKSSGTVMILKLLILILVVFAGLAILINISLKKSAEGSVPKSNNAENQSSSWRDVSEAEPSSEVPIEVSSETAVSSEEIVSSEESVSSKEAAKITYKQLQKGDKNKNVLKMQNRLCELGYCSETSCTGYYGEFTENKVKQFQLAAGLEQTGTADPATLERLYAKDAPKHKR